MKTKPKAVGYIRVSTDRQAENGQGLRVQERAIRDFCRRKSFKLIRILRDEGVSGTTEAQDRPGLSEALELLRNGGSTVLVVPSLDRLARSLTAQEGALAHAWRLGARVFTVDAGEVVKDDPEDPMRTAMRKMIGVFSELERGMINARLRKGRREKSEQGGYAYGSPPYGAKSVEGKLVPDEQEQKVIRFARKLHRQKRSLRTIARALDAAGHKPRRAGSWSAETVRALVSRSQ